MHKRILKYLAPALALSGMAINVYAVAPGFYLGFMGGPATNGGTQQTAQVMPLPTQANPTPNTTIANPKSTQFGSRLYMGYKFNQYAAFEGGFVYFSGVNFILKDQSLQPTGGTTARVRAIDFVGKVDYSFQNTFGIFAKAGVAAIYSTTPGGLNPTGWSSVSVATALNPTATKITNSGSNTYSSKVAPVLAIGGSYDLNQNWVMDVTWTRYLVGGAVNNMDLYALGISYHFVDKYCGQFLCD